MIKQTKLKVHTIKNGKIKVFNFSISRDEFFNYYKTTLEPNGYTVVSIIEI